MIKSLVYNNGKVTIVFDNGNLIYKSCTKETAQEIINSEMTEQQIFGLLVSEYYEIQEKNKKVQAKVELVTSDSRYYYEDNALYRVGIKLSIPESFADAIIKCIQEDNQEELNKLDKLWMWSSLIKRDDSRNSLYNYLVKNNSIITSEGFFINFRRAWFKGQSPELIKYVSDLYIKRRGQKKGTNINVYESEDGYNTTGGTFVGVLAELYNNKKVWFESEHKGPNGSPRKYYLGKEYQEPEELVEYSGATCSSGIHSAGKEYDFSGYGDTVLVVAINPAKIANCPENYSSKMRTSAITPIAYLGDDEDLANFELTSEMENFVHETFKNNIDELETIIANTEYSEDLKHILTIDDFKLNMGVTTQGKLTDKKLIKLTGL